MNLKTCIHLPSYIYKPIHDQAANSLSCRLRFSLQPAVKEKESKEKQPNRQNPPGVKVSEQLPQGDVLFGRVQLLRAVSAPMNWPSTLPLSSPASNPLPTDPPKHYVYFHHMSLFPPFGFVFPCLELQITSGDSAHMIIQLTHVAVRFTYANTHTHSHTRARGIISAGFLFGANDSRSAADYQHPPQWLHYRVRHLR